MHKKIFLTCLILMQYSLSINARAALRRTPKVYNALITTDDNLTSSRAYPVIQPTIHETGIPHYPFGPYSAYGYYSPNVVRFGQPIAPGLVPREQLPYPLPNTQFPPQIMSHPPPAIQPQAQEPTYEIYPTAPNPTAPPQNLNDEPQEEAQEQKKIETEQENEEVIKNPEAVEPLEPQQPVIPPKENHVETQAPKYMPPIEENKPQEMANDKLPIALNEFGLPPSLIPLHQYPTTTITRNHGNSQLPPYVFNQYPLLNGFYDPLSGFREQYLPPYEYSASPPNTYAIASALAAQRRQATPQQTKPAESTLQHQYQRNLPTETKKPEIDTQPIALETQSNFSEQSPNFENIKNVSKYQNIEVPDVPPPPIPSGAKTKSASS